jgi:hypothetical protein
MVCPSQVETRSANGQETQRADRHAAHSVHALRGAALQQGDIIADLRARMRCNEVRGNALLEINNSHVYCDLVDHAAMILWSLNSHSLTFPGPHGVGATCAP